MTDGRFTARSVSRGANSETFGDRKHVGRNWPAVVFLLLCAPVVVDLQFGATQLSTIIALIPETLTYGVAAVLIRAVARRLTAGWVTILLWALAFTVVSECLIVQTSLAPLTGLATDPSWGRAAGVNWPYFVWALGYISVWAVIMSINLAEVTFPTRRNHPWLGPKGRWIAAIVFIFGGVIAWHTWTRVVVPRFLHRPLFSPPPHLLILAATAAVALLVAGWVCRRASIEKSPRSADPPGPQLVGLAGLGMAAAWFALTVLPYSLPAVAAHLTPAVPVVVAIIVGAVGTAGLRRWASCDGWDDRHRIALIGGALTASMAAGYVVNHFVSSTDLVAKIVLNVAALAACAWLYRRAQRESRSMS